ncbi:MAG: alkaline phosphatase family protein [Nocardioides sp.]
MSRITSRLLALPLALLALVASLTVALVGTGLLVPAHADDADDEHVRAVLTISVDGFNPKAIKALGEARTPTIHRLMAEGAFTLKARTEYESTSTLPNHTGMLTGLPVSGSNGHHVDFNEDNGSTVQAEAGRSVGSVLNRVHTQIGSTAMFVGKSKFDLLQRSFGPAIDQYTRLGDNDKLTDAVIADLQANRRAFTFVHLSAPDGAGHEFGYMSQPYLDAIAATDARIGRILAAVTADAWMRKHLVVIVTSDHGGLGTSHADETLRVNYRIPFIVWGARVERARLYRINPHLANPGKSRPGYSGAQPVRNGMVANLVTDLLDASRVKGSFFNRKRKLTVFRP